MKMIAKFRGKRIDGKGWVYGCHVEQFSMAAAYEVVGSYISWMDNGVYNEQEVHPDSVGMWTGKQDKNGVDVYFGQRLKSNSGTEYEVVWIELMAAFWVIQVYHPYEKYTAEIIPKCAVTDNPGLLAADSGEKD